METRANENINKNSILLFRQKRQRSGGEALDLGAGWVRCGSVGGVPRTNGMVHHGGEYEAHQTTGGAGSNTTIPVRGGDSCDTAKDCHPWGIGEALPAHQICYPLPIKLLPIGLPMWPELLVRRDLCRKRPHYRRKALDSLENCYAERKTAKARPAMS